MAKTREKTENRTKMHPVLSDEAREKQLISMAYDVAEQKLIDGTASSQLITHFLKLGSEKEKLEREKLEKENELLRAKTEALEEQKKTSEEYEKVIKAMRMYSGIEIEYEDSGDYDYD